MDRLCEYVIRLSATALLCAVVMRFARGSSAVKMMIKLLCGIVLAYSIIQPVRELKLSDFGDVAMEFRQDADRAVQWGKNTSAEAWAESILQGTEAYILEKAKDLNLDLNVEVELSNDEFPVPVAVSLAGNVAPYAKSVLADSISRDLNIPKENQKWISR